MTSENVLIQIRLLKSVRFSILFIALSCNSLFAQQGVGIGTNTPDASSILDITANNKGVLFPRLTTAQMMAIVNPATGLMVYNTSAIRYYYFNGNLWKPFQINLSDSTWLINGNAGTNSASHFIGTTDNQPLLFRVNNLRAGEIDPDGNIFMGVNSGFSNIETHSNVAIGSRALFYNTYKSNLVAIGDSALFKNGLGATTSGEAFANTAIGSKALLENRVGSFNTATGLEALKQNNGYLNSAYGFQSLINNTSGSSNTGYGVQSLFNNSMGNNNSAIGYQAAFNNMTGNSNSANGHLSLFGNNSGSFNVGVGRSSGFSNSTGSGNVFIGYEAGFGELGSNRLYIQNSNADSNNALIYGQFDTKRLRINGNIGVGIIPSTNLHVKQSATSLSGIRVDAATGANNWTTRIDNNDDYAFLFNGVLASYIQDVSGTYVSVSDRNLKKDISEMEKVLPKVVSLRPVNYRFKNSFDQNIQKSNGFIAQEVLTIFPEVVFEKEGKYGIAYDGLIPITIKAIQEQQAEIEDLKLKQIELSKRLEELQQVVMELKLQQMK